MYTNDDKLPSLPASSITAPPRRAPGSRARASLTAGFLPAINSHRTEFTRPSHISKSQPPRHTMYFRSHVESGGTGNISHRRTSHDAKRLVSAASARSHTLLEKFTEQVKKYHTFQPTFVEEGVYSTPKLSNRFVSENAKDTVAKILNASTSRIVRHNADQRINTMIQNIPSNLDNKRGTTIDLTSFSIDTSNALTQVSSLVHDDKHSVSFQLWRRENPGATSEEIRQKRHFWDMERANYERNQRIESKKLLWNQLEGLGGAYVDDTSSHPTSTVSREVKMTDQPMEIIEKRLEQKMQWEIFIMGEISAKRTTPAPPTSIGISTPPPLSFSAASYSAAGIHTNIISPNKYISGISFTSAIVTRPAPAAEIISDYRKNVELHNWIEGKWRHHTHQHENAALRIQCAYRCHLAKSIAARRRYIRRIAFLECLKVEEESRHTWVTAIRLNTDEPSSGDENFNKKWRYVSFVFSKLHAIAMRRKAQKKAEAEREREVREYAAITIQRMYRGYCGRQTAMMIRHPELLKQRQELRRQEAAIFIQSLWRGYKIRKNISQKISSVLIIQRLVRSSAARVRLRALRAEKRVEVEFFTKRFASTIILRFLKKCVQRRRIYMMQRQNQLQIIQRIALGCITRISFQRYQFAAQRIALWVQRKWRGNKGRLIAKEKKKERDLIYKQECMMDAIKVIQRAWRKYVQLKKKQNLKEKKEIVLNDVRSCNINNNERLIEACLLIQRMYRSIISLRKAKSQRAEWQQKLLMEEAAERILRFYRTFKSRQQSKILN